MNTAPWFQSEDPEAPPQHFLVAGPCLLEDARLHLQIADVLLQVHHDLDIPVVFKGSFDKANRTTVKAKRGPGIDEGLAMLASLAADTGLPVLTDIHDVSQVRDVQRVVDVVQIPAALCRQTD